MWAKNNYIKHQYREIVCFFKKIYVILGNWMGLFWKGRGGLALGSLVSDLVFSAQLLMCLEGT